MEIRTLLKANLRHKRSSFFSILFLMFLITMSYTAIISNYDNISRNLDLAYERSETGDLVSYISDTYYTKEMADALLANADTDHVRDAEFLYVQDYTIDGRDVSNTLLNLCEWNDMFTVMNDTLTGITKEKRAPLSGEVFIPLCLKTIADCDIGSTLTIKTNNGEKDFIIKGFIEEPLTGAFVMSVKQVYINSEDYTQLKVTALDSADQKELVLPLYHMIHLFQSENSDLTLSEYKRELNQETKLISFSYTTLSKEDSKYYTLLFHTIGTDILYVFIFFLCIIILIIMGHSITTGIEMDYVNYGILKAVGFTKKKLQLIILLQYSLALLIGSILGLSASILLNHYLCNIFLSITGIYTPAAISVGKSLLGILLVLIFSIVCIIIKTNRIGAIAPIQAISGNQQEVYFSNRLTVPVKKSCLQLTLAIRQLTSNKKQYFAGAVISALLVFFLMCMTILTRCITANGVAETFGGSFCDIEAVTNTELDAAKLEEIKNSITKITPLKQQLYVTYGYVLVDDYEFNSTSYSDTSQLKNVIKGRAPVYDNEIAITEIVARDLNKKIGDTVTVSRKDTSMTYMITGYIQSTVEAGRFVIFTLDGKRNLGPFDSLTCCYTVDEPSNIDSIITMLNDFYGSLLTAKVNDTGDTFLNTFEHSLSLVTIVIYAISALFAFVTILMIGKKSFLKEQHDIGIYKALGFSIHSLRLSFALRFLLVALFGAIFGLISGYLLNEPLLSAMLTVTGITNFHTTYNVFTFAGPVLLVCFSYFVFAYLSSNKMKMVAVQQLITE